MDKNPLTTLDHVSLVCLVKELFLIKVKHL